MLPITAGRLPVAVLDAHALSDDALRRIGRGASHALLLRTSGSGAEDLARWAAAVPDVAAEDGGAVADVRDAIETCAVRKVLVLATGAPNDAARFVARALQGAAAATEHDVPGVAVHVVRDRAVAGPVGWLSQTGAQSGYGVLFAMGYAQLHDLPVVLVEPAGGLGDPRTPEARDEALALAARVGLDVTTLSDPSPLDRVMRDPFSLVVHPVLDAPGGRALLHRDELPRTSVAEGNPAALVRLLEDFDGDVVAVLDGVHLLGGDSHALQVAAGVVLAAVAATGIGVALAPSASAAGLGNGAAVSASVQQQAAPGVTISASGHNGNGDATVHVVNRLDHPITIQLEVTWVHSGNHPPQVVKGAVVTVPAGSEGTFAVGRPAAIGQGGYHVGPAHLVARGPSGPLLTIPTTPDGSVPGTISSVPVPVTQLSPHFRPPVITPPEPVVQQVPVPHPQQTPPIPTIAVPPLVVTGTPGPTITGHGQVPPVIGVPGQQITGQGQVPPVQQVVTPPEPIVEPPLPQTVTPPQPTVVPPTQTIVTPPEPIVEPPLPQTVTPPQPTVVPPTQTIVTPPQPIVEPPLPQTVTPPQPTVVPPTQTIVTPPQPIVEPPLPQTVTPPDPLVIDPPETGEVTEVTVTTTPGTTTSTTTPQTHTGTTTSTPDIGTPSTGSPELAHTGTGAQTGILAGLAAALIAAGAGIAVATRRKEDEA